MKSDEEAASNVYSDADELIVRAKSDRAAFSQLYERYYSEVLRYCLRRLRVRAVAEDVISDVFLQIASVAGTAPEIKDAKRLIRSKSQEGSGDSPD